MSISITWGLIARMDGILSAEPLMYCVRTNSHNFAWSPNQASEHCRGIAMCHDRYS